MPCVVCQLFQCLDLEGRVLPEAVDGCSLEPVYLQNLRDLSVSDTVSTVGFFLSHLNFPTLSVSLKVVKIGECLT
jgi:hypothetical protein